MVIVKYLLVGFLYGIPSERQIEERCADSSHQTLDSDHGIIIGLTVTPGDVHDTVPYLKQVESVHQRVIPLRAAAADSAYDFPLVHRELEKLGIDFFVRPQLAHDRTKVEFKRDTFIYDAAKDVYIFVARSPVRLNNRTLCQQTHFVPK